MISRWADAHEGADKILALVLAIVRRGRALVHVYAVSRVRSQSVAIRADASEGARGVVATEGALVAQLETLVHVLADLVHSRGESFVARTLKTPFDVRARPVAAYVLLGQAFVVVHAPSPTRVQHVARGALASEGAIRVYALATRASVWHEQTLVQVDPGVVPAWSLGAQSFEFLAILRRTLFAIFPPCLAHGATTVFLCHRARSGEGTSPSQVAHISVVTQILPDVDASHRIRLVAQSVSDRALADHSTLRVDTPPIFTDFLGRQAFVHVHALLSRVVQLVTERTSAYVRSH